VLDPYFNHQVEVANSYWTRAGFLRKWRQIYRRETRWTPPYYPALRRWLATAGDIHPVYMESYTRRRSSLHSDYGQPLTVSLSPLPTAAVVLRESAISDGIAFLSLLHLANDQEICEHFLQELAEISGARRFVGPVGISPYLAAGAQLDHWHETTPLHAPYSPPYLAELLESQMDVISAGAIYEYEIPEASESESSGPVRIAPLDGQRLAGDLLSLMQAALTTPHLPPPDQDEVSLVLGWLGHFPLSGHMALIDDEPVGFVLLQPDLARRLRKAGGGRYPWQQIWFDWWKNRPASKGRLLLGAVLPKRRRQGIGRRLWHVALSSARQAGWNQIAIGPVDEDGPGAAFLTSLGARPGRRYRLYSWRAQSGGGWW